MRKAALGVLLLLATSTYAQTDLTAVLKLPGMESVDVRKDVVYQGERKFDLYRPRNAGGSLPLVVFLNGVGWPGLKEWGQYTSWPRLVAASGMAAITYETEGGANVAPQTAALLRYVREHAGELKVDSSRIAIWACSANVRLATAMIAEQDFRAAALYYGVMSTPPREMAMPVFVTRAGLDSLTINDSIDRWVARAVTLDVPVTLISYPQGLHGFDLRNDTAESRSIIRQTVDFLQFHLTNERPAAREPITPSALSRLVTESGAEAALARIAELRRTHPRAVVLEEQSLNFLGYSLINESKPADAVKIFEVAVAIYPESANLHDSLGDAYERAGRAAEAIAASTKALALLDKAPERQRASIRESAEAKLKRLKK